MQIIHLRIIYAIDPKIDRASPYSVATFIEASTERGTDTICLIIVIASIVVTLYARRPLFFSSFACNKGER